MFCDCGWRTSSWAPVQEAATQSSTYHINLFRCFIGRSARRMFRDQRLVTACSLVSLGQRNGDCLKFHEFGLLLSLYQPLIPFSLAQHLHPIDKNFIRPGETYFYVSVASLGVLRSQDRAVQWFYANVTATSSLN